MLRLYDARSGTYVTPGRDAVTRVGPQELGGACAWAVTMDLVRRVAARHRVRVAVSHVETVDEAPLLNARFPPTAEWRADDAGPRGGPPPAEVSLDVRLDLFGSLDELTDAGVDPLALRLAFLTTHYVTRRVWVPDDIAVYDWNLQRLRRRVAGWAETPSQPMSAEHVRRVHDAFDDDLDTPRAMSVIERLDGDPSVPDGVKLETFLHLDELLGLDLARDIGRAPPRPAT